VAGASSVAPPGADRAPVNGAPVDGGTVRAGTGAPALTVALARRAFRDARTRTVAFAWLFLIYAYIQPAGFAHAYPTLADRLAFARSFAGNDALRLFYGYPYDPVTVGGYSAWRVGGTLAIAAAVVGLFAAVRALRGEEDTGRMELVLAGALRRRTAYVAALSAIATGVLLLWLAETAGFIFGGLPAGESAYLALATASVIPVYVGVGALVSQLAPTRRMALELGLGVVGLSLLLRVVADTSSGAGWLRWLTPLGWAEELRPFTSNRQPLALLPALATTALLLTAAAKIYSERDIGTGVLPARDRAAPRMRLLSSPLAQGLRSELGTIVAWLFSVGVFALILGAVSTSISPANISASMQREIAKLGGGSIATPTGYMAFVFVFFILIVSLFACAQVASARHEEADERLETLLALPVSRGGWLAGRLALAAVASLALGLAAGFFSWAGAAAQGSEISPARMLEAGANCMPVTLLFLGIAALLFALVPRASGAIAYGLVTVAFLWQLTGALLSAPKWLLELTPFAHVGLVPAQPFRPGAAIVMVALAAATGLASIRAFDRRDLTGQ
jgi:ABC-2 type transport system permease protein